MSATFSTTIDSGAIGASASNNISSVPPGVVGATGSADNYINVVWDETSPAGTYFIVTNEKSARKVIGEFKIPPGGYKGRIFVPVNAQGSFIVAGDSGALNADRSIGLCTRRGPAEDLDYDPATTAILGAADTPVYSVKAGEGMTMLTLSGSRPPMKSTASSAQHNVATEKPELCSRDCFHRSRRAGCSSTACWIASRSGPGAP